MPSIDIDRDGAHLAAQTELGKSIYSKASAAQQFTNWLNEQIYRLSQKTASIPGGWFTTTVLLILLAVAVVVAVHIARRTMRTSRGGDYLLFLKSGVRLRLTRSHRPELDRRLGRRRT